MDDPVDLVIPPSQTARRATSALRGYAYQLYATAEAWLGLGPDECLLVEVAEDYAIAAAEALQSVQVKDEPSRRVTLRSTGVIKALDGWWAFRRSNPNLRIGLTYLTTALPARETGLWFPQGQTGLECWNRASAIGADLDPLRVALAELNLDEDFRAWIANADDQTLRRDLIGRVDWRFGQPSLGDRASRVRRHLQNRPGQRLAQGDTRRAFDAILHALLSLAAGQEAGPLTSEGLNELIEAATSVTLSIDQLRGLTGHREPWHPPLHLRLRDPDGGRLFFFAAKDRLPLVGREAELLWLWDWCGEPKTFSWTLVTGPGGSGKSRLGLELCLKASEAGWSAGFLSIASAYAAPEHFLRFEPHQPTLMVVDYAGDEPEAVGKIVRTLIERAIAGDVPAKVRVLLLDRTGPGGGWMDRFNAGHERLMRDYSAQPGTHFLHLPPLESSALSSILRHVLGDPQGMVETALADLAVLDPEGRPLFAALAADALRTGRELRQLGKVDLMADVLGRERRLWRRSARDGRELRQHELALALATMTGELHLPGDAEGLPEPLLPFSAEAYSSELMASMTGRGDPTRLTSLEPDIIGEWLVVEVLRPRSPFDSEPAELMAVVDRRIAISPIAASAFTAFRIRLVSDFPEAAADTPLLLPPADTTPDHVKIGWLDFTVDAFPALIHVAPSTAATLFDAIESVRRSSEARSVQRAAATAHGAYGHALVRSGCLDEACATLSDLLAWSGGQTACWATGNPGAVLAVDIVFALLDGDDTDGAEEVFSALRAHAARFLDSDDPYEIADAAAHAGLALRDWYADAGCYERVEAVNDILWAAPVEPGGLDLCGRAGQVMMQRSRAATADHAQAYEELKARTEDRPEVHENGFWAAFCGISDLSEERPGEFVLNYIDRVRDVAKWLEDHAVWPDMDEALNYAVEDELLGDDFGLGRRPIERLFNAWSSILIEARRQRRNPLDNNALIWIEQELEAGLARRARVPWATAIKARMIELQEAFYDMG